MASKNAINYLKSKIGLNRSEPDELDANDRPNDYYYNDYDPDDEIFDEFCGFEDNDEDNDEDYVSEKLTKKKVVRNGKKVIKWSTDKAGYKVDMVDGKPKEVKMSSDEKRKREKG